MQNILSSTTGLGSDKTLLNLIHCLNNAIETIFLFNNILMNFENFYYKFKNMLHILHKNLRMCMYVREPFIKTIL